jgi:hypothetical protein
MIVMIFKNNFKKTNQILHNQENGFILKVKDLCVQKEQMKVCFEKQLVQKSTIFQEVENDLLN